MAHPEQPNLNIVCYIKPPKPLVVRNGNNWQLWRQQYEWFEIATQMTAKPANVQVATFMLSIGAEAQAIYSTWNTEPSNVTALKNRFQNYFVESGILTASSTTTSTAIAGSRKRKLNEVVCKSYSDFETISDSCLSQIAQYLNILDFVHLAATCTRLRNFANDIYFPKEANVIEIEYNDDSTFNLKHPSSHFRDKTLSKLALKTLQSSFDYFGQFVKELSLSKTTGDCLVLLEHCHLLTKLSLHYVKLTAGQAQEFQHQFESLQNLKELHFSQCPEIIRNWPPSVCVSNVEKLAVNGYSEIPKHFFEYFKNLSSFFMVFDFLNHSHSFNEIAASIRNLPKMENLALEVWDISFTPLFKLPHLKSLSMWCGGDIIKYSTMRKLSDNGIIENLWIRCGSLRGNCPPLQFNRLRHLTCRAHTEYSLWKFLTRSQMPALQSLHYSNDDFQFTEKDHQNPILKFFESKITVSSIYLELFFEGMPFAFLQKIIEILKKPCTPKRPLLKFYIHPLQLSEEQKNVLKSNLHLIEVKTVQGMFNFDFDKVRDEDGRFYD